MHVKNRYDKENTKRTEDRADLVSRHDKQQQRLADRYTEERSRQEARHTAERTELREEHKTERSERRSDHELQRTEQKSRHASELNDLLRFHEEEQTDLASGHDAKFKLLVEKHYAITNPLESAISRREVIQGVGARVINILPTVKAVIGSGATPNEIPGRPFLETFLVEAEPICPVHLKSQLQDVISLLTVFEASQLSYEQWRELKGNLSATVNEFEDSLVEYLKTVVDEREALERRLTQAKEARDAEHDQFANHKKDEVTRLKERQNRERVELTNRHAQDEIGQIKAERADIEQLRQQQGVALVALTNKQREEEKELDGQQSTEVTNLDATQLKEIDELKAKDR
jgi:hypothetical protein